VVEFVGCDISLRQLKMFCLIANRCAGVLGGGGTQQLSRRDGAG
jgi:hypothetical protein